MNPERSCEMKVTTRGDALNAFANEYGTGGDDGKGGNEGSDDDCPNDKTRTSFDCDCNDGWKGFSGGNEFTGGSEFSGGVQGNGFSRHGFGFATDGKAGNDGSSSKNRSADQFNCNWFGTRPRSKSRLCAVIMSFTIK